MYVYSMKKKKPIGRPELPENERRTGFPARLHPSIIERIEKQAKKEKRPKSNLVEKILDENLEP